jgi:hypothetical protein
VISSGYDAQALASWLEAIARGDDVALAERLNQRCHCVSLDRPQLHRLLAGDPRDGALHHLMAEARPHLFSESTVFLPVAHARAMAALIGAIEAVVALPAYQEAVLAHAPASARRQAAPRGVFLSYDFHIGPDGPRLIEINTNAGGALLSVALARAQKACCEEVGALRERVRLADAATLEGEFVAMFREEWWLARGSAPLARIAIVDDEPGQQYLLPEFILFQQLFQRAGLAALVCDPRALRVDQGALWRGGERIDLVYNRLTDFSLDDPAHATLAQAWREDLAVITPHPRAHALYADKRNLIDLSDPAWLARIGVDGATRSLLAQGIPATRLVRREDAGALWSARRGLFFKPASGFGGRAAYRGDKLTRRVFEDILAGDYIAQALVPPGERQILQGTSAVGLKMDLRNYVYGGRVQLLAARLYQGQTTNFRTPGGGFAPVVVVPAGPA